MRLPHVPKRSVLRVAVCATVLWAAGCVITPPETAEWPEPETPAVVLQAGDEVEVIFRHWPDLNSRQTVRIDGRISMQLIGEIEVVGLKPAQLQEQLVKRYESRLKDPEITVVASTLGNQRVYVGGEVSRPGVVLMTGRLTLLEAIMQAGGPLKQSARLAKVVVVRQKDGKRYARAVNIKKALEKAESDPFELAPFDVVFVPRTSIDRIDQWIDQHINQIIPRNFHANYTWVEEMNRPGM